MDTTSPLSMMERHSMDLFLNTNHLLLNRSFQSLFECLLQALTKSVDDQTAFNLDTYILSEPYGCDGNVSFSTALLSLYTLLANNRLFREYVFAYTEIDKLILSLMHYLNHVCYEQIDLQISSHCHTVYLILIILLIFCADIDFLNLINTQIIYGEEEEDTFDTHSYRSSSGNLYHSNTESMEMIAWYRKVRVIKINSIKNTKANINRSESVGSSFMNVTNIKTEHIEAPISLGSFVLTWVMDLFQNNLVNFRDSYINSNCLAILSNLAPLCVNLHRYPSNKLINFTNSFIKRINKKLSFYIERIKKQKKESLHINKDSKFMELLSMTNQLMSICRMLISKQLIPGNKYALYWLMQNEQDLVRCSEQIQFFIDMHTHGNGEYVQNFLTLLDNLGNEISAILNTVYYFNQEVTKNVNESGWALDMEHVINIINEHSFHWKRNTDDGGLNEAREAIFEYEESDNSVEFFLPFIWRLICKHSGIHFHEEKITIFKM